MSEIDSFRIMNIYRRIGLITCSSVFLLFLLGGLVRATGSGMGCPDWPKCFGLLAPPTCECELPNNYQEIFKAKREKKVAKFLKTLRAFGLNEKADLIAADKNLYLQHKFDPLKAWIEYINRLFGVLSGLLAVLLLACSFLYKSLKPTRLWAVVGFVMLILNAWLGSIVVTTNLLPGIVSLHFLLAFLCLFAFILSIQKVSPVLHIHNHDSHLNWRLLFWLVFVVVLLGTWSREQVDILKNTNILYLDGNAMGMLNFPKMGIAFVIHRYVPLLILIWAVYQYYKLKSFHWGFVAVLSLLQISLGVIHIVYVVPSWTQIGHVFIGSALLTYSFLVTISYKKEIL